MELITPALYEHGEDEHYVRIEAPAGATVFERATAWQVLDAIVLLDAWLPWTTARTPFDGWRGGAIVSYVRADDQVCFSAAATFEQIGQARAFDAAITEWAAAAGSAADPTTAGTRVDFEACERATDATLPPRPVLSTAWSIQLEHLLIGELSTTTDSGAATDAQAAEDRCVARTLIDDPQMADVFTSATFDGTAERAFADRQAAARAQCTSAG